MTAIEEYLSKSTEASGVPLHVTDEEALLAVAGLLLNAPVGEHKLAEVQQLLEAEEDKQAS